MGNYLLYNTAWIQLDQNIFVKKINKTIFIHDRVGIPKEISLNFGIDNTKENNKLDITLQYKNNYFSGYLEVFSYHRSRMIWHSDFSSLLKNELPNWEQLLEKEFNSIYFRFEKKNNLFKVEIIDLNKLIFDYNEKNMFIIEDIFQQNKNKLRYITQRDLNELIVLYHGLDCEICGFNFEEKYGSVAQEFIEILRINETDERNKVNFKKDYSAVCSNCKSLIQNNLITYEDLLKMYEDNTIENKL